MKHLVRARALLLILGALLIAWPAAGDTAATNVQRANGCKIWTLCSAETDTTAACDASGDNIVAQLAGNYVQTLYATQSTATAFVCHLFSSDNGYSATLRQQITTAALTESQYVITIEGPLDYEWIECSTVTGGNVTVTSLACPIR